jgi:cytochrome c2
MKSLVVAAATASAVLLAPIGQASAADVEAGSKVFNKCKACHSLAAGKNMVGPSLHGLFGRKAGTADKYNYSKAMKDAGAGGLVWSEKTLHEYLKSPKDFVKGNKMTFIGIKKDSELDNLTAFLKDATK